MAKRAAARVIPGVFIRIEIPPHLTPGDIVKLLPIIETIEGVQSATPLHSDRMEVMVSQEHARRVTSIQIRVERATRRFLRNLPEPKPIPFAESDQEPASLPLLLLELWKPHYPA